MKRNLLFSLVGVFLFGTLVISASLFLSNHVTALAAPSNSSAATNCGRWTVVPSANPSTGMQSNELLSVAAISSNDAWAVGYRTVNDASKYPTFHTLIEHWNGKAWSVVPSVDPAKAPVLQSVVALSSQNVWAVGYYLFTPRVGEVPIYHMLVEHWNGKKWSLVPSPNPFPVSTLMHISAISPNDIWASGALYIRGNVEVFDHWNGKSWNVVSPPKPLGDPSIINDLAAVATNNVWAVGGFVTNSIQGHPLVEHWNGKTWSTIAVPQQVGFLQAISVVSANDIWMSGTSAMLHWNGKNWSVVAHPKGSAALHMTAISTNSIWSVGYVYVAAKPYDRTSIEHWNGKNWSIVSSPNVDIHNELFAVTKVPGTSQLWAVGGHGPNSPGTLGATSQRTLTLSYC